VAGIEVGGSGIDQGRLLKRSEMQKRLEKWSVIGAALVTIVGFPLLIPWAQGLQASGRVFGAPVRWKAP
jgi:hypothetical protein